MILEYLLDKFVVYIELLLFLSGSKRKGISTC